MSAIQQWLKDLEVIASLSTTALDMQKFTPIKLHTEVEHLDQTQLQKTLELLGELTGWIQETGKVHTLDQQKFQRSSFVLNGEWIAEGHSYVLEHLGRNEWELTQYHLQACDIEQATHLAEKMQHQQVGTQSKRYLQYQRLWQPETEETLAPKTQLAIFTGFAE